MTIRAARRAARSAAPQVRLVRSEQRLALVVRRSGRWTIALSTALVGRVEGSRVLRRAWELAGVDGELSAAAWRILFP